MSILLSLLLIFFLLLLGLSFPYISFDHVNYLNFIESPSYFYFEPIFTALSFLVSSSYIYRYDYGMMILLSIYIIPLCYLIIFKNQNTKLTKIFFILIIKSSVVGLISIRFWMAELWFCAMIIYSIKPKFFFIPFLTHYGSMGALPIYYALKKREILNISNIFVLIFVVFLAYIFVSADYSLGPIDYSRYVNFQEVGGSIYLTSLTIMFLIFFSFVSLKIYEFKKILIILILIYSFKIIFSDLDVYSRIYQIQLDLVLIYILLNSNKFIISYILAIVFALAFSVGMLFVSSNSIEIRIVYNTLFENFFLNIQRYIGY